MKKVLKFMGCITLVLLAIPVVMLLFGIATSLIGSEDISKAGTFAMIVLMTIFVLMVVSMVMRKVNSHGLESDYHGPWEDELRAKALWQDGYHVPVGETGERWDGLPQ